MFPTGLVGVALLVLRIFVAITIVINLTDHWTTSSWIIFGAGFAALSLCLGLLTPYFSVLSALLQSGILVYPGGNRFQLITSIVGSGIVTVLGPGAYSIDSRIFGRKLLELPPKK